MTSGNRLNIRVAMLIVVALVVASCSSETADTTLDESPQTTQTAMPDSTVTTAEGCSLPSTVKVAVVKDQTGPNAEVGVSTLNGVEIGIDQVNSDPSLLGSSELVIDVLDTTNSAETAATHVTSVARDDEVVAILGPPISDQAQAVSPIANEEEIPIIFNQAGSEGVVTGDWTFRVSPPLPAYFPDVLDALPADATKLAVIGANDNPTLIQMDELLEEEARSRGLEITSSQGLPNTLQDYSAPVTQALAGEPDAIVVLVFGSNFASLQQELTQAGFDGAVLTFPGSLTTIQEVAESAIGTVWPTNFFAAGAQGVGAEFAATYEAEHGVQPNNYAAEGYDSVLWLAYALDTQQCATREAVREGLVAVGSEGFEGAQGQITTVDEGRDARTTAHLVQWDGSGVVAFAP